MSAPQQAREELAVRFIEAMLASGKRVSDYIGGMQGMVDFAFKIADCVISKRSPGS